MELSGRSTRICNAMTCSVTIVNLSYVHTCNNISSPTIFKDCALLARHNSLESQSCLKVEETYNLLRCVLTCRQTKKLQ